MATKRTYAVGSVNTVWRRDDHAGAWINIAPVVDPDVRWADVKADPNDPDHLVIVGWLLGAIPGGLLTGILVSFDAGVTWLSPGGTWANNKDYQDIWFVDSNTIWVVGDNGYAYLSTDGGLTFNVCSGQIGQAVPGDVEFTTSIHAISATKAVVTGYRLEGMPSYVAYESTGADEVFVWKTVDGGANWIQLNQSLPGTQSLVNTLSALAPGYSHGVWLSDNEQTVIVSTVYNQQVSTDGGFSFTCLTPETPRSIHHMTWYKDHDVLPEVFRRTGGLGNTQVIESTDGGATWTVTKPTPVGSTQQIYGAHFYTLLDGYYVTRTKEIFTTSDGGVTGVVNFVDPSVQDNKFWAVWTQEPVTPRCFGLQACDPDEVIPFGPNGNQNFGGPFIGTDIENLVGVTLELFFQTDPDIPGRIYCVTVVELLPFTIGNVEIYPCETLPTTAWADAYWLTVQAQHNDCEECLNPQNYHCYNLISCEPDRCPDILNVINDSLSGFVGQYVSFEEYPGCTFLVRRNRQVYGLNLQTSNYSPAWAGDPTFEALSLIVNGTELITSAQPTYTMTPGNYNPHDCSQTGCIPVVINTTENCIANLPDYLGGIFASLNAPLEIYLTAPQYCGDASLENYKIQYSDGDTFTLVYSITTGVIVIIFTLNVTNGNVTEHFFTLNDGRVDVEFCNRDSDCTGEALTLTILDCADECPVDVPTEVVLDIRNRTVRPGYDVPGVCSPEYHDKVNCKFVEAVFQKMASERFGIAFCCETDLRRYEIKKMMMDLALITDPSACLPTTTSEDCCPPCNVVAVLQVFEYQTCAAPTNVEADWDIVVPCLPPDTVDSELLVIWPCVNYHLIIPPLVLGYTVFVNCNGQLNHYAHPVGKVAKEFIFCAVSSSPPLCTVPGHILTELGPCT